VGFFCSDVDSSEGDNEAVTVKAGGGKRSLCWVNWLNVDGMFIKVITTFVAPIDETTFFAAYGVYS
jgi:hypothetical protein